MRSLVDNLTSSPLYTRTRILIGAAPRIAPSEDRNLSIYDSVAEGDGTAAAAVPFLTTKYESPANCKLELKYIFRPTSYAVRMLSHAPTQFIDRGVNNYDTPE